MIGFNPTPELRNYSHIIIANIKTFIIKHKLKIQNTSKLTKTVTVSYFRVEMIPIEPKTLRRNQRRKPKTSLQNPSLKL